jgi:hypothetical protein
MTGETIETNQDASEQPAPLREENGQLEYIARYIWSVQRENEALRQRVALLEAV